MDQNLVQNGKVNQEKLKKETIKILFQIKNVKQVNITCMFKQVIKCDYSPCLSIKNK